MVNELKVFYNGDKGLITFDNKKTVFQHKFNRDGVKIGLGKIVEDSVVDKGNYAFAIFENIETVIPEQYYNIDFFVNRGLPVIVEKGLYGENIVIKETYKDKKYIRAYKKDGSVGLYESEMIKNDKYEGQNVYFSRLNDLVTEWKDITEDVVSKVFESIKEIKCNLDLNDEVVLKALKGLGRNRIYVLENGSIVADGKFESLIIWKDNEIKMCWLGRKLDLESYNAKEITSEFVGNKK